MNSSTQHDKAEEILRPHLPTLPGGFAYWEYKGLAYRTSEPVWLTCIHRYKMEKKNLVLSQEWYTVFDRARAGIDEYYFIAVKEKPEPPGGEHIPNYEFQ